MTRYFLFLILSLVWINILQAQQRPIIDIHDHAWNEVQAGPEAQENQSYLKQRLTKADSLNIVRFVASGSHHFVSHWKSIAGEKMISGAFFPCIDGNPPNQGYGPCFPNKQSFPDISWLRNQFESGVYEVMGELLNPYAGVSYNDDRMTPYYELAEELDIPVAVHLQGGPPLTAQHCCPDFRLSIGDPFEVEEVLVQFPDLRLHIMHGNIKWIPSLTLLLKQYPNIYVDLTPYQVVMPRAGFHDLLREYKLNGLIDRVMFGTDGAPYEVSIEAVESADFLTKEEKSGIFCKNAARFLGQPDLCK